MDRGERETEKLLKEVERRINKEYKQAINEIEANLQDYFRRFEKKDDTWRGWVEDGKRTREEYEKWRFGQMAVGRRWQDQINSLAKKMADTNEEAMGLIRKHTPEMYAENYNYSTYEIEKGARIDTSFNLINEEAVERLMRKDPEVLPPPGKQTSKAIAEGKAIRWNRQQLQSVMVQGILQGDSITKLATRLANTVGDRNRKAAIRNARTMATGAQNAGRVDAYKRAQSKGVDMEQMWLATLDNRTRHSHRWLDREVRPVGEAFSNGCEYPGDPKGDPAEIYNCRCSIRGVVKGLDRRSGKFRDNSAIGGMSYDEWRNAKVTPKDILFQQKKSEAARLAYIKEYMNRDKLIKGLEGEFDDLSIIGGNDDGIIKSVIHAKTKDEALEYSRDILGLKMTNFDNADVRFVNALNEEITGAYFAFGNLNAKGCLNEAIVTKIAESAAAAYNPQLNQLKFSPETANNFKGFADMKKIAQKNYKYGYWSTDQAAHIFRHELGHAVEKAVESNATIQEGLNSIRNRIKNEHGITEVVESFYNTDGTLDTDALNKCKEVGKVFSYYGLTDNGEMIAEAVAEYLAGNPRMIAREIVSLVKGGL